MRKGFYSLLIVSCFIVLPFIGCAGIGLQEAKEIRSIKEIFAQFSQRMVQGDLKAAYDLVSIGYKKGQSYEDFVKDYETYRNKLVKRYQNAFLNLVAVEDTVASAWVIWGTGEKGLLVFIKEGKTWKLAGKGKKSYS